MRSILEQFASDAINAPVAVTGGKNQKCGGGSGSHKSHKSKSHKSKKSHKSHKSGSHSGSNKGGCWCPPPPTC